MGKRINAVTNDVLGTLDAVAIAEAIRTGQVSAAEVTEAAIIRAEKVNGELNAIVYKTFDSARSRASAKPSGLLGGVPTFIKDNEMVKGIPTQMGTGSFKSKPAPKNGKFVDQYLSTGLVSLGKSTMPEFGFICSTENPKWGITRNPWDTDYTTGGSSSGSAAMVASGVVPIALANDGAGSIRIPAACCGLVGLKPTRERLVNAEGVNLMPINIIYEGVLTRSVRDTAAFFAAAEQYYRNPKLPELGNVQSPNQKKLKVAFFENMAPGKLGHQDDDTYNAILDTAKLLTSLGHQVDMLKLPFDIEGVADDFLNYYGMLSYALLKFGTFILGEKPRYAELENFTTGLAAQFSKNMFGIRRSMRRLKERGIELESFFGKYDLLMTPVLAHTVPKIGHFDVNLPYADISRRAVEFASFTGIQNITGAPAISIPLHTDSKGLPLGIHFVAPHGQDKLLIELAYELEIAKPWKFIYNS